MESWRAGEAGPRLGLGKEEGATLIRDGEGERGSCQEITVLPHPTFGCGQHKHKHSLIWQHHHQLQSFDIFDASTSSNSAANSGYSFVRPMKQCTQPTGAASDQSGP